LLRYLVAIYKLKGTDIGIESVVFFLLNKTVRVIPYAVEGWSLVENGVVSGYDDGYYRPEWVVTRDQMAVYVARAFGLPM